MLHVKSNFIRSPGLETSSGSMMDTVFKKAFGWLWPSLSFPPYQSEETEERYPGTCTFSFPSSSRQRHFSPCTCPGPRPSQSHNGELCLLLGPEIGIPQCRPLKPLAGFTLVLSLNAAPSQGDRTQGKALVEKSKKSRETSRRKNHQRGETHHTREKAEKQ